MVCFSIAKFLKLFLAGNKIWINTSEKNRTDPHDTLQARISSKFRCVCALNFFSRHRLMGCTGTRFITFFNIFYLISRYMYLSSKLKHLYQTKLDLIRVKKTSETLFVLFYLRPWSSHEQWRASPLPKAFSPNLAGCEDDDSHEESSSHWLHGPTGQTLSTEPHSCSLLPFEKKNHQKGKKNSPRTRERLRFRRRAPRMRRLRRASSPQMGARSRSGSARAARARPGARLKVGDGRAGGAGRRSGGRRRSAPAIGWRLQQSGGWFSFFFYGVLWAE